MQAPHPCGFASACCSLPDGEDEASSDETDDALNAATLRVGDSRDSTEQMVQHRNTVVWATQKQGTAAVEHETSVRGPLEEVDDKVLKVVFMVGQTSKAIKCAGGYCLGIHRHT
jgi:hypothetical protein